MAETVSIVIAILALAISGVTAWLTLFRRGVVCMTPPTVIFFGPDGGPRDARDPSAKIYLRTLLYATSKRGRIVESMFVRLRRGESLQTFNIWVLGEDSLSRGSGVFVGENGVVCNHHFLLPADGTQFEFTAGTYYLEVYCTLAGSTQPNKLFSVQLAIDEGIADQLKNPEMGLYYDWGPESARYHAHVRPRPKPALPDFIKALAGNQYMAPNVKRRT
ncbi:MAG: hypothetical protein WD042_13135 [Phycisphaeraceae bacterium]